MTVTAAQVSATMGQLSQVASWLEQAGAEHAEGIAQSRGTLAALPSRWRGPASQETVEAGRHLIERAAPVSEQLRCAVGDLRRTVEQGTPVTDALRFLERHEEDLQAEMRATAARAAGEADPVMAASASRRAVELQEQLRRVQHRRSEQQQAWLDECRRAAGSISEAVGRIQAANGPLELRAPAVPAPPSAGPGGGGLVGRLREGLDAFDRVARSSDLTLTAVDAVADAMLKRATAWKKAVRRTLVVQARVVRVVIGPGLVHQHRELVIHLRRFDYLIRRTPPAWLVGVRTGVGRAQSILQVLGKLPFLGGPLSGLERWDKDTRRPEITGTEQWLRAILEGGARGATGVALAAVTALAVTAASAATGPLGGLAVLLIGAAVSVAFDHALANTFDLLFDEKEWSQESLRWVADRIDDAGRMIGSGAETVVDSIAPYWELVSDTWRAAEEYWSQAIGEGREQVRDLLGIAADATEETRAAAESTWGLVEERWAGITTKLGEGADVVRSHVSALSDRVTEATDTTWARAEEFWSRATDGLRHATPPWNRSEPSAALRWHG